MVAVFDILDRIREYNLPCPPDVGECNECPVSLDCYILQNAMLSLKEHVVEAIINVSAVKKALESAERKLGGEG